MFPSTGQGIVGLVWFGLVWATCSHAISPRHRSHHPYSHRAVWSTPRSEGSRAAMLSWWNSRRTTRGIGPPRGQRDQRAPPEEGNPRPGRPVSVHRSISHGGPQIPGSTPQQSQRQAKTTKKFISAPYPLHHKRRQAYHAYPDKGAFSTPSRCTQVLHSGI